MIDFPIHIAIVLGLVLFARESFVFAHWLRRRPRQRTERAPYFIPHRQRRTP